MIKNFLRSQRSLIKKPIASLSEEKNRALAISRLIENHNYQEATEKISELISGSSSKKGTKDYNEALQIQAMCYNFCYDYKSAEQNFFNIIQYIKHNSTKEFKSQDIIDAKFDLLQQYTTSNLAKAKKLIDEMKTSDYKSLKEDDQALVHFYEALYYQLQLNKSIDLPDPKGEARKKYIYIINHFPNLAPIRYYSLHNLVVMNWDIIESSEESSERLLNEIKYVLNPENKEELQLYINSNLRDIIKSNISEDHFNYVMKDFIMCLYILGGLYGDFDYPTMKRTIPSMINAGIPTLLSIAEILLQRKATREEGKEFLDLISQNLDKNNSTNRMKFNLLYGAYHVDKKNYSDAVLYFNEVTQTYLQPWHQYDKAMAHQFMGLAYQKLKDQMNSSLHAEESERINKRIIQWHKVMVQLQIPPWRHIVKQNM